MAIVKRLTKGAALTHTELDGNFTDLDGRVTTLENTADSDSQTLTLAGDNLTISGGNTVDLSTIGGLNNLVEDTTPQLGGALDLNGNAITGPDGSSIQESIGVLTIAGTNGINIRSSGTNNITIGDQGGDVIIGQNGKTVDFVAGSTIDFTGTTATGLTLSQSIDSLTDVDTSTTPPGVGQVLKWDGSVNKWLPANDSSGSGGITLSALSVTQASAGTAGLVYNNVTGVFTYTPPDLSSYLTSVPAQSFASLTGKPTTIAGYGITDAASGYGDSDVATYLNGNLDTSIIPDTNATYDIGSASNKIRHLFLSDNSLYIGDNTLRTSGSNLLLNNTMVNADTEYNNGAIIDVTGEGSDFFKRELTVNGVRIMGAGGVGGQTAVPDAWLEKVGRMFELFLDPTGSGITESAQRTVIKTLSGDTGTYHAAVGPTIQRVARGAGADYSTNFLTDPGIIFWNLTNLFNNTVQNDMVWYLNSTGSGYGDGDTDAQEVIEHVFHTLHMHGLDAVSLKMYPSISSDWNTGPLYNAMVEAYDGGFWDSSGYGGADFKTDSAAFEVAAKEYLYLLNFAMFDYSDLWDGASLSPEWADSVKTPAGVQSNLTLGYALYNSYIAPVISKPSLTTIRSIFQDGNTPAQDDPSQYGASGYVVDVFNGEFGSLAGKPTTLAGYGITDAATLSNMAPTGAVDFTGATSIDFNTVTINNLEFADISATPTTLAGYGITDAVSGTGLNASIDGHLNTGTATGGQILSWNGSDYAWVADQTGISPTLNTAGNTGTGSVALASETLTVTGTTGQINVDAASFALSFSLDSDINSITSISFEGTTPDTNETKLQATDPTADRTINLPDATGNLPLLETSNLFTNDFKVEEAYSATPTNKFFEVETGAGNNRFMRSGINMSGFGTGVAPGVDLTSYRSSPADGDAGPELVFRASTAGSSGSVIATIETKVIATASGAETTEVSIHTDNAGTSVTPFKITGNTVYSASLKLGMGVEEKFSTTNGATGVTVFNGVNGHVHYLTAPAGNVTANFTNLNGGSLTAEYATNVTVIVNQGATARIVSAVQIGGAAQTINWQGNNTPSGTSNGIDAFSFTILNDGGTYVVLGQMVPFGGV